MREGRRLGGVGAGCIMCLCLGHWHSEQFAGSGDVVGTSATGEQAVVSDAMEALRQHVDQEAPDELVGRQRHRLVPARLCVPKTKSGDDFGFLRVKSTFGTRGVAVVLPLKSGPT